MRRPSWAGGVAVRIAAAAFATTLVGVAILALGVAVVGGQAFTNLMVEHGQSTDAARRMFDASLSLVIVVAVVAAIVAGAVLAVVLARRIARPLHDIGTAARRIADGDYAARVPTAGPDEVTDLAASFNQMAASLEEQERMRRDFIANAAHELRTPLTNLQGYLEALRDGVIQADRATFESLHEEADRLVRLADSLDTLAAGDAGLARPGPARADLGEAISSAVELAAPGFERAGIRLTADRSVGTIVRIQPDDLAQVLGNLLQNAVRYTPAGGLASIAVDRAAGQVTVSVTNTGEGIPTADLGHVFERFYRVEKSRDRAHGGAGIGLAIVRQLIEAAGGRVGVASVDERTRFWFSLSTVERDSGPAPEAAPAALPGPSPAPQG